MAMNQKDTMIEGLEELEDAVRGIAGQQTGHAAKLLQILAGIIHRELRNANDTGPLAHLARRHAVSCVRKAFHDVGYWGVRTPIGKALLEIYNG